jgi:hypothetical protein
MLFSNSKKVIVFDFSNSSYVTYLNIFHIYDVYRLSKCLPNDNESESGE